jgi:hypothetical protein
MMTSIFSKGNFDKNMAMKHMRRSPIINLLSCKYIHNKLMMGGGTFGGKCQGHEKPQGQRLKEKFKSNF